MRLIDIVNKNSDKPWNWFRLSMNPNITFDHVLKFLDKPWNWYGLSIDPSITFDDVLSNPDKPWNWNLLSSKVIKFPQMRIEYLDLLSKI